MGERKKILITVKTYPIPSAKYIELVCTGGVQEDGSFIRLYPIDYRCRPQWEQYKKYQWTEVDVERRPKDPRPETFRLCGDGKITLLGEPIPTSNNWAERKKYVLAQGTRTMCELNKGSQKECSLSIVRPSRIQNLIVEETERSWKKRLSEKLRQGRLFGPKQKPLEKIPYKFSYRFRCEYSGCNGHTMMIEDWEIGELYRKMRDHYRDEAIAVDKVKQKFFDFICAPDRDTHFFVGTVLEHGTWVILGAFYPKTELALR